MSESKKSSLGEYQCHDCWKRFRWIRNLDQHRKMFHTSGKAELFSCSHCAFTSKFKRNVTQHYKTVHEGFRPFCCGHCDYRASRKDQLRVHYYRTHPAISGYINLSETTETKNSSPKKANKIYSCSLCKFDTPLRVNLNQHMLLCHPNYKQFGCLLCTEEYSTNSKKELKAHAKEFHGLLDEKQFLRKQWKLLSEEEASIPNVEEMTITAIVKSEEDNPDYQTITLTSAYPGDFQNNFEDIKDIISNVMKTSPKSFYASDSISMGSQTAIVSGTQELVDFSSGQYVQVELPKATTTTTTNSRKPHLDTPWKCELCNKCFSIPYGLKRHLHEVHKMDKEEAHLMTSKTQAACCNETAYNPSAKHRCEPCQKSFSNAYGLRRHMANRNLHDEQGNCIVQAKALEQLHLQQLKKKEESSEIDGTSSTALNAISQCFKLDGEDGGSSVLFHSTDGVVLAEEISGLKSEMQEAIPINEFEIQTLPPAAIYEELPPDEKTLIVDTRGAVYEEEIVENIEIVSLSNSVIPVTATKSVPPIQDDGKKKKKIKKKKTSSINISSILQSFS